MGTENTLKITKFLKRHLSYHDAIPVQIDTKPRVTCIYTYLQCICIHLHRVVNCLFIADSANCKNINTHY